MFHEETMPVWSECSKTPSPAFEMRLIWLDLLFTLLILASIASL